MCWKVFLRMEISIKNQKRFGVISPGLKKTKEISQIRKEIQSLPNVKTISDDLKSFYVSCHLRLQLLLALKTIISFYFAIKKYSRKTRDDTKATRKQGTWCRWRRHRGRLRGRRSNAPTWDLWFISESSAKLRNIYGQSEITPTPSALHTSRYGRHGRPLEKCSRKHFSFISPTLSAICIVQWLETVNQSKMMLEQNDC